MEKKLILTVLIALMALFAFGQITIPKNNETFVISKVEQQLKGLKQNDYQRSHGLLFLGKRVFPENLSSKSSSIKQKLDSVVDHNLNATISQWIKSSKDEYKYDASGKWTTGIYYNWNSTTSQWVNSSKDEFTYNANGKWATDINSEWNTTTSQWVNNLKNEYSYNGSGYSTQILISDWDVSTNQWVNNSKYEFTYNGNGYLTQVLVSEWDIATSQWVASIRYDYTYDANNNYTLILIYSWDKDTSQWENAMKHEFTYDASSKLTMTLVSIWMDEWIPYTKDEYTYDANSRLATDIHSILSYTSFPLQLVLDSKDEYSYDANGNITQDLVSKWDASISQWVYYSKDINTYDLSYSFSDLIFPSGYSMIAFAYLISISDVYNKPLDDIEYLWNKTITDWDNNIKTIYYYSELNGSGVNDLKADKLIIYPNPVSEGFRLNNSEKNVQVSIYDLSGSLLFIKQISDDEYINVSTLSQGLYMVRVTTEKGSATRKFVKK